MKSLVSNSAKFVKTVALGQIQVGYQFMVPWNLRKSEDQRVDPQRLLIELLISELDDCFKTLKLTEITQGTEDFASALKELESEIQFVRYFERGIEDPMWRWAIHHRADVVEKAFARVLSSVRHNAISTLVHHGHNRTH